MPPPGTFIRVHFGGRTWEGRVISHNGSSLFVANDAYTFTVRYALDHIELIVGEDT